MSRDKGGIAFVSRKMGDNGISAYVTPIDDVMPAPAGELSCALSGNGVLATFLQEEPFYTGFHVARLKPLVEMTKEQLLYYCACIVSNRYRFSYGRQANRTLKKILVPAVNELPSYVAHTDITQYDGCDAPANNTPRHALETSKWLPFTLPALFYIFRGEPYYLKNSVPGSYPYISATANNNGVTAHTDKFNHQGGCITLSYDGSIGEAFFQSVPFFASEKIAVLKPKEFWSDKLSPAVGLFICSLIRQESYRYTYGRKWSIESRMKTSIIKLPVVADGAPDWDYMETYIKTLPYSSQLQSPDSI